MYDSGMGDELYSADTTGAEPGAMSPTDDGAAEPMYALAGAGEPMGDELYSADNGAELSVEAMYTGAEPMYALAAAGSPAGAMSRGASPMYDLAGAGEPPAASDSDDAVELYTSVGASSDEDGE